MKWLRTGLTGLGVVALLGGIAAVVVLGFVEGRHEAQQEAEREEPIKPPLRVTLPERGEPVITLDAQAQEAIALTIFGVFMVVVLGQPLGWRYVAAFGCIMAAVGFMFIGQ